MRHLPQSSAIWYSCIDRLAGTCVIGDPSDNTREWAVKYDHETFDQFLFATNDISHYTFMEKSKFLPHVETNIAQFANLGSSITPEAPGTSEIVNLIAYEKFPSVALTRFGAN